jgi:carbonic anhydrase
MISASQALQRLRAGNERFADGNIDVATLEYDKLRKRLEEKQEPFAIVLGCSDSRVPVELVFGHGLGDLFVIRVAGNIVAPSTIGSIEFAVQKFGTRLIVILGHTGCGAIKASLEALNMPGEQQSENLQFIVDQIRPAVERTVANGNEHDPDALVSAIVRENVRRSAEGLQQGSEIIAQQVSEEGLMIVSAEYSLRSGKVEFF